MKEDSDLVYPEDEDFTYLVRVPQKKNGDIVWKDSWLTPEPAEDNFLILNLEANTELQNYLGEVKRLYTRGNAIWEVGVSYYPQPVQETKDERPFYPKIMVLADHPTFRTQFLKKSLFFSPYHSSFKKIWFHVIAS